MRFEEFYLTRFGHFTDRILNLKKGKSAHSDFHIIYGPNEAGKSTTLSAFMDFLFDYPKRNSPYIFKHKYDSLELGALVDIDDEKVRLTRTRKYLVDKNGNPVNTEALNLQGISREDFGLRFCFDGQNLQDGGDAILKQRGELGSSLFSATTGLSDFNTRINDAMKSSIDFYEPGRKNKDKLLTTLIEQYNQCKDQLSAIDTSSSQYKKHVSELEQQQQEYDKLNKLHHATARALETARNSKSTLNISKRIEQTRLQMSSLKQVPDAPMNWLPITKELSTETRLLEDQLSSQTKQLEVLKQRLDEQAGDTDILSFEQTIKELIVSSASESNRISTISAAESEIATINANLKASENQLNNQLDISTGVSAIPDRILTELETSLSEYFDLNASLQHEKIELKKLSDEDVSSVSPGEIDHKDPTAIKILLEQCREQNTQQVRNNLEKQIREQAIELDVLHGKIKPFSGNIQALAAAISAIEEYVQTQLSIHKGNVQSLSVAEQEETKIQAALKKSKLEITQLQNRIAVGVVNDELNTRELRDNLWKQHVSLIEADSDVAKLKDSASQFFQAMTEEDLQLAHQINNAETTSQINQLNLTAQTQEAELEALRQKSKSLEVSVKHSENTLTALLDSHGFSTSMSADRLEIWLSNADAALKSEQNLANIKSDIEHANKKEQEQIQKLSSAMQMLSIPANYSETAELDEIIRYCTQRVDTIDEKQQTENIQAEARARRASHLELRQSKLDELSIAIENWTKKTNELVEPTWLGTSSPENIRAALPHIRSFNTNTQELQRKNIELTAAKEQSAQYKSTISSLNSELKKQKITDRNLSVEEIDSLFTRSVSLHRDKINLQKQIADLEKNIQSNTDKLLPKQTQISTMLKHFSVTGLGALEEQLQTLQLKRELDAKLKQDLEDLEKAGIAMPTSESLSEDEIQLEIDTLLREHDVSLNLLNESFSELQNRQAILRDIGDDDKITQLRDELANLKLQIVEGSKNALQSRLGQLATEEAIRIYRDEHRSNMMKEASTAFARMTSDRYTDLRSRPAPRAGAEELIGIGQDGTSKTAQDMSDGTRSQLYLSLKVAAYYEYCETKTPCPFIADDVMEKFDDTRAAAALKLFSDMGKKGQVLYLTHHQHLVDIAKKTLGASVNIIEL